MTRRLVSVLLTMVLLVSCFSSVFTASAAKAEGELKISGSKVVAVGKKITLSASMPITKWKSSDKKIATVSEDGVVKGKKPGKVKITAKAEDGSKKTWKITVYEDKVKSVKISASTKTLDLNGTKTVKLKAKASPDDAAQEFTWKSSDPSVAKVSSSGKVTAVSVGKAKITATAQDGSKKSKSITIKVKDSKKEEEPETENVTLVYAEVNPINGTVAGSFATAFKEKAEEISEGHISVDLLGEGTLGSEGDYIDDMMAGIGTIDICRVSLSTLNGYGSFDRLSLLSLPYLFENHEHFWKFANSDLAKDFLNEPRKIGMPLRGLAFGEEGFRHFFFNQEVEDIKDFKNLKIRVSTDSVMVGTVSKLGAKPTVVAYSELYTALQAGVVDGAEQPIANYKANSFNEVAPYLVLDGHTMGIFELVISDTAWEKLSSNQRSWIQEAAAYASQKCRKASESRESSTLEALKKAGVTVVKVTNKQTWRNAVQDVILSNLRGLDETYNSILAMK